MVLIQNMTHWHWFKLRNDTKICR